ncbi:I78 family peptidase inhibitor [uncultured Jannaschia sp.]|uniref:I78 family peptidase inhibitor n=1 Tax=uncultured Jannaschia sp. TaxID=293347 RepID=UPI002602647D|nr:I78 family peptidase inhibitor [uncultured Jannaschia sp.]
MNRALLIPIAILPACQEDGGCGAEGYADLIGRPVAAITLPADLPHRVVGPDDMVTMDHRPDRLNIRTDADGTVVLLACG